MDRIFAITYLGVDETASPVILRSFPMIVVTAPTSNIGHQVLANILATGGPIRVIARDPSRLPARTRERVEVVQGSHSDFDVVSQAFRDADAVFWLVPPSPVAQSLEAAYLDFTRSACEAIRSQASPTRRWNFSPRPWDSGRGQGRASHGVAGDG